MTLGGSGWSHLDVSAIASLDAKRFEDLCYDMVQTESFDRHDDPVPDGPAGPYTGDGGRDILLTVKRPPTISRLAYQQKYLLKPLTDDAIGRTAYSCKTGDWLKLALKDAKDPNRGKRAVQVLAEGGHFKLFISQVGLLDELRERDKVEATPKEHLVRELAKRVGAPAPGTAPIADRIEILDANDVHRFLIQRKPEDLLLRFGDELGITKELHPYREWRDHHDKDRVEAPFRDDEGRTAKAATLTAHLATSGGSARDRVSFVFGPSGIGKTRTVLWALEQANVALRDRLRVAYSQREAHEALSSGFIDRHPDAIVVVDDCSEDDAHDLATLFMSKAGRAERSHLVVIVPVKALTRKTLFGQWPIEALNPAGIAALVRDSASHSLGDGDVQTITQLAEGFPYFAVLLAREASEVGRAPSSLDQAVDWVLASRHEANTDSARKHLRSQRCRALAAIALTRGEVLERSEPAQREKIARAVMLPDWPALHKFRDECRQRGLVRPGLGGDFAYVTPLILEREVLRRMYGPGGPDNGGRILEERAPEMLEQLLERLSVLDLGPELRGPLARAAIEDLHAAHALSDLTSRHLVGPRLMFVAREAPATTAAVLRELVDAASIDDLRVEDWHRRDVVWALDHVVGRTQGFADAEAALFRLAQAENETYGNNATAVWRGIFSIELSAVHVPLAERTALLKRRLLDREPRARSTALGGVEAVLETRAFRLVGDSPDGEPRDPTVDEAVGARRAAWDLLVDGARDEDLAVAARAKAIALDHVRGGVRGGMAVDALGAIAQLVPVLSPSERVALRGEIDEVKAYDGAWLGTGKAMLDQLESALAPTVYGERLRDAVGRWPPAAERRGMDAVDAALARDGLAGDHSLLSAEVDWLFSGEARRARPFLWAVGQQDREGALLPELIARADDATSSSLVAAYVEGLASVLDEARMGRLLDDLVNDTSRPALALLASAAAVGLTDQRVLALIPIVAQRDIDPAALLEFGRRAASAEVATSALLHLVRALLDLGTVEAVGAALEVLDGILARRPDDFATARALVEEAVSSAASVEIVGVAEHYWERVAKQLVDHGGVAAATDAALAMLGRDRGSAHPVWPVLQAAFGRDDEAAWASLAGALETSPSSSARLVLRLRFARSRLPLPPSSVLDWVGTDERRGRMIASIVTPNHPVLPPVLRELIRRFGVESAVAREVAARMRSTRESVPSLADDDLTRARIARAWQDDDDPIIRDFATRLAATLEEQAELEAAIEEGHRARYGT